MLESELKEEFAAALEAATGCAAPFTADPDFDEADIYNGFNRILMAGRPDRGLEVLARTGALGVTLPECNAMVGFGEGIRHKDVWAHTKQVVRQTPARLTTRWAGLLHDIGKVPTRRFLADGQVTFIGHPEIGARMFERIAGRLPFPLALVQRLKFLIAGHLRAAAYEASWTDSAVRRFARDADEALPDLLDLARADITSKYEEKVRRGLRQINLLAERIEALQEIDSRPQALPAGLGNALMARFQLGAGPALGRLMTRLKHDVEEGKLPAGADFPVYITHIELNAALILPQSIGAEGKDADDTGRTA